MTPERTMSEDFDIQLRYVCRRCETFMHGTSTGQATYYPTLCATCVEEVEKVDRMYRNDPEDDCITPVF